MIICIAKGAIFRAILHHVKAKSFELKNAIIQEPNLQRTCLKILLWTRRACLKRVLWVVSSPFVPIWVDDCRRMLLLLLLWWCTLLVFLIFLSRLKKFSYKRSPFFGHCAIIFYRTLVRADTMSAWAPILNRQITNCYLVNPLSEMSTWDSLNNPYSSIKKKLAPIL